MGGTCLPEQKSWLLLWWAELSKTLICLSADGWGWVPSLLVVWPKATLHCSLPGLFGGANGGLWEGSCQGALPRTSAASVLVLTVSHSHPLPLQETLQRQQVGLVQSPMGSLLLPLGPDAHTTLCVESLFPPVPSRSCNQILPAFKVWLSRNSSSCCQTPRLGSLMGGSEPSLQWVDFHGISVLQFVSHSPSSYGIWFYCDCAPPTVSLWLLLCLWMWGIFFGEFQCLPVDDYSAVSCDSGALARGSESTSFYSAILNQSPIILLNYS